MRLSVAACGLLFAIDGPVVAAQVPNPVGADTVASSTAPLPVPALVRHTGEISEQAGQRVALRFAVYASATATSALWSESQNVTVASDGKYSVLLGAGSAIGMPQSLFTSGETRWLSVAVGDAPEAERVMLVSVPYAIKAGDAETLSGHPVAELVTQDQLRGAIAAQLAAQELTAKQVLPETTPAAMGTPPILKAHKAPAQ